MGIGRTGKLVGGSASMLTVVRYDDKSLEGMFLRQSIKGASSKNKSV